jgi:hypothetical protein
MDYCDYSDVEVVAGTAIIGWWFGLTLLDVSEPAAPEFMARVPMVRGSGAAVRDVAVVDGMAYAGTSGYPPELPGVWLVDLETEGFPRWFIGGEQHVTAVAGRGKYVYAASEELGLRIVDVERPDEPEYVGHLRTPGTAQRVTVADRLAHAAGVSGLAVVDFADPERPALVGQVGEWYLDTAVADGNLDYVYATSKFGDVARSSILAIDNSEAAEPRVVADLEGPGLYWQIEISDGYAFVALGYESLERGLFVWDIADPEKPRYATHLAIDEGAYQFSLADSRAYVVGYEPIVHIVDISNPLNLREVGAIELPQGTHAMAVAATERFAYVATTDFEEDYQLLVYELSAPDAFAKVGSVSLDHEPTSVTVEGSYAYLTFGPERAPNAGGTYRSIVGGLLVVSIRLPTAPSVVDSVRIPGNIGAVSASEDEVFVAADGGGLVSMRLLPHARPTPTTSPTSIPPSTSLPSATATETPPPTETPEARHLFIPVLWRHSGSVQEP